MTLKSALADSVGFKVMSIVVILILALICSFLPIKVAARPRVMSALNMAGGGVFLSTGLVHLLSEGSNELKDHFPTFPMAYFLAGCGFILTLVIEEFAMWMSRRSGKSAHSHYGVEESHNEGERTRDSFSQSKSHIHYPDTPSMLNDPESFTSGRKALIRNQPSSAKHEAVLPYSPTSVELALPSNELHSITRPDSDESGLTNTREQVDSPSAPIPPPLVIDDESAPRISSSIPDEEENTTSNNTFIQSFRNWIDTHINDLPFPRDKSDTHGDEPGVANFAALLAERRRVAKDIENAWVSFHTEHSSDLDKERDRFANWLRDINTSSRQIALAYPIVDNSASARVDGIHGERQRLRELASLSGGSLVGLPRTFENDDSAPDEFEDETIQEQSVRRRSPGTNANKRYNRYLTQNREFGNDPDENYDRSSSFVFSTEQTPCFKGRSKSVGSREEDHSQHLKYDPLTTHFLGPTVPPHCSHCCPEPQNHSQLRCCEPLVYSFVSPHHLFSNGKLEWSQAATDAIKNAHDSARKVDSSVVLNAMNALVAASRTVESGLPQSLLDKECFACNSPLRTDTGITTDDNLEIEIQREIMQRNANRDKNTEKTVPESYDALKSKLCADCMQLKYDDLADKLRSKYALLCESLVLKQIASQETSNQLSSDFPEWRRTAQLHSPHRQPFRSLPEKVGFTRESPIPSPTHNTSILEGTPGVIAAVILWVALSFHAIMEGLALGASKDSKTSIFIAIVAHKGLESFALSSRLLRSDITFRKFAIFAIGFSLMTPIGIGIGMALEAAQTGEGGIVANVLLGLAAGTFLYAAIVEVILTEMRVPEDQALKLTLLIVCYGLMSLLAIWA